MVRPFGLKEVARPGRIAHARESHSKDSPSPEEPLPSWEKERKKIPADLA